MNKNIRAIYWMIAVMSLLVITCAIGCGNSSASNSAEEATAKVNFIGQYVRDNAGLLTDEQAIDLETMLGQFDQESGLQYAVVTVASLAGKDLDAISLQFARELGIGNSGVNNGCLILIAQKERKVKIDVGYGLEWQIPDSISGKVLNEDMLVHFKDGNYFNGLKAGFEKLYEKANSEEWNVAYSSFVEVQTDSLTVGKIMRFHAKSIAQRPSSSRMYSQFDPSFFFESKTITGETVVIRHSQYMLDLVERIHAWNDGLVYGRIISTSPLEVNLLGIQEL